MPNQKFILHLTRASLQYDVRVRMVAGQQQPGVSDSPEFPALQPPAPKYMLWIRLFLPFAGAYFLSYHFRTANAVIGPVKSMMNSS